MDENRGNEMSMSGMAAAMAALLAEKVADEEGESKKSEKPDVDRSPERVKALLARLNEKHTFAPGDLVQWKEGLKNKTTPDYGQPLVVAEVLAEPVTDAAKESGSLYFREPLDLISAEIDSDGDFLQYHYHARRVEPCQPRG